jgi:hypothetical protein
VFVEVVPIPSTSVVFVGLISCISEWGSHLVICETGKQRGEKRLKKSQSFIQSTKQ